MGLITRNPMMMNFLKAQKDPSAENNKVLMASIPGQEAQNNNSMVSGVASPRKRARQLQTSSRLNNQQTLLGS